MIVDAQVHGYAANTAYRPWISIPNWPASATGRQLVDAMDKLGVAGSIFVSSFAMYGFDATYAIEVQKEYPERFALVKPIDIDAPDVAEIIQEWKNTAGAVGIRIFLLNNLATKSAGLDLALRTAAEVDLPVNLMCWGNLDIGTAAIDGYPNTRFVLDHLGISQPPYAAISQNPWTDLPKVIALAQRPNVVLKVSGACTLSREPYPFSDIWGSLFSLFDAWGLDRCLWGTDWTRTNEIVKYEQAVECFRSIKGLNLAERAMLLGGACVKTYKWQPTCGRVETTIKKP